MLGTKLDLQDGLRVLCIGAHADDIEIGCGGAMLHLLNTYEQVEVCWLVCAAGGQRTEEAHSSAQSFLAGAAKCNVVVHEFPDGFLPWNGEALKREFRNLAGQFAPSLIFTHTRDDHHQDHRLVNELTWQTWRDQLVLEYEIPKYDGDLGRPNTYIQLDLPTLDRKIELLMEHYGSQRNKDWFEEDTFRSLARLRGMECRSPSGYAEAFHVRKVVVT